MAWQDVTIRMMRIIINDYDSSTYEYSDDRLAQTLVVAAQLVNQEIDFDTTYEDVIKEYGTPQDGGDLSYAPIPERWISYDIGIGFDFIIKTEDIIIISIQKKK